MYNGIGLQTVRGTGTSGYVQTNKFNLNRRPAAKLNQSGPGQLEGPKQLKADESILEHNRKREIEKKVLELEEDLIDKGLDPPTCRAAVELSLQYAVEKMEN